MRGLMKKIAASVISVCMAAVIMPAVPVAADEPQVYTETVLTNAQVAARQEEIRAYVKNHSYNLHTPDTWSVTPDYANEVAGRLSEESETNALNALNCVRFIAGVPEIGCSDKDSEYAMAAATFLNGSGQFRHTNLNNPDNKTTLYDMGKTGAAACNLAGPAENVAKAIIDGWTRDNSHALWCLDPEMRATGFGSAGNVRSMYAMDRYDEDDYPAVSFWPATVTPLNFYNGFWMASFNDTVFDFDVNAIVVTMTNKTTGVTQRLTRANNRLLYAEGINEGGYGSGTHLTMIPDSENGFSVNAGDVIHLKIENLKAYRVSETQTVEQTFYITDSVYGVPTESISLDQTEMNLVPGESESLDYQIAPDDVDSTATYVTSSAPSVAVFDMETGKVKAIADGTAVITVETADRLHSAKCTVHVQTQHAAQVTLDQSDISIERGGSRQLYASVQPDNAVNKNVLWYSSNAGVATVSDSGMVAAVSTGTATITVKTVDGDKTASCRVTVYVPDTGIRLDRTSMELKTGDTARLTATVIPADATKRTVTWSSTDTSVATVNGGIVKAVGEGDATIIAVSAGGFKTSCKVRVSPKDTDLPDDFYGNPYELSHDFGSLEEGYDLNSSPVDFFWITYKVPASTELVHDEMYMTVYTDGNWNIRVTRGGTPALITTKSGAVGVTVGGETKIGIIPKSKLAAGTYETAIQVKEDSDFGAYDRTQNIHVKFTVTPKKTTPAPTSTPVPTSTPAPSVTPSPSVTPAPSVSVFTDVTDAKSYYYAPVYWAREHGITSGKSETSFAPKDSVKRAEMITFLYRYYQDRANNGSYKYDTDNTSVDGLPFRDINRNKNSYYLKSLAWGYRNGIVKGTSDTTFSPGSPVTRGQMLTFMFRASVKFGGTDASKVSRESGFADVRTSSAYAQGITWGANAGITNGKGNGIFDVNGSCTRGEGVTFLHRADQKNIMCTGG